MKKDKKERWLADSSKIGEAETALIEAVDYLTMMAHRGNFMALKTLVSHTGSCVNWVQAGPRILRGAGLKNLTDLLKSSEAWPIILPAEQQARKKTLEDFSSLPLAEETFFKVRKSGAGRPSSSQPGEHELDLPSNVGRRIVRHLEFVRFGVQNWSLRELEKEKIVRSMNELDQKISEFCYLNGISQTGSDYDPPQMKEAMEDRDEMLSEMRFLDSKRQAASLLRGSLSYPLNSALAEYFGYKPEIYSRLRMLPSFSAESSDEWRNISFLLIEDPVFRSTFVPASWDQEALRQGENGKGKNAHVREKLKNVFKSLTC